MMHINKGNVGSVYSPSLHEQQCHKKLGLDATTNSSASSTRHHNNVPHMCVYPINIPVDTQVYI